MPWTDEDSAKMDMAAQQAAEDLATLPIEAVKPVAEWIGRWYRTAGYKRLGRLLFKYLQGGLDKGKEET